MQDIIKHIIQTKGHSEIPIKYLMVKTDRIDHILNDVILCLLLQLPESIAYCLSNNVIKVFGLLAITPLL